MSRIIAAAAAALVLVVLSACGVINGLQGVQGVPGNSDGGGGSDAGGLSALSWHGPEQLDQGFPTQSDSPRLAWGQGKAWVAWHEYNQANGTYRVWLTNRDSKQDFATPQAIGQLSDWDGGAFNPNIAIGATGDPVLIVQEVQAEPPGTGTFPTSIWGTRLSDGLTVTPGSLVRLDASETLSAKVSQTNSLSVDAAGNALAVWSQNEGVFASGQARTSGWTNPLQLDTNFGYGVDVTSGAAGSGLVSWSSGSSYVVNAVPLGLSSGELTPGALKQLSSGISVNPVVAMRGDKGIAFAAGPNQILTATYNGGVWSSFVNISDNNLSYYIESAAAINSKGQAVLVWRDAGGVDNYGGTLQASFWNGNSWSLKQTISAAISNPRVWWAQVDIDDTGSAVVAWADYDSTSTYTRIYANVLELRSGTPVWKGPVAIDQDSPNAGLANEPENVRYVNVALEPLGGHAQVTWIQHESGTGLTPRTWSNWLE